MHKLFIPILAAAGAFPTAVNADQTDKGFYLNISPGLIFTRDFKYDAGFGVNNDMPGTVVDGEIMIDDGYFGQYGLGYSFGNNYRVEINYTTMQGKIKGANYTFPLVFQHSLDYTYQSKGFVVNFYKDFYKENRKINPYIGLGFGPTKIDMGCKGYSNLSNCSALASEETIRANTRADNGFMYQIKAGIGYKLSNKSTLFVEKSYVSLSDFEYTGGIDNYKPQGSFGISSGLRFKF